MNLDLGTTPAAKLPTDERIKNFANGTDPQLAALYFQFGRYLLISSSRPGGQAANLQGLWNESMDPPWGSKYTININTEMNYWPAEPTTNLAECVDPLIAMVMDLTNTGAQTAKEMYGARGWVEHHNTDLWRASAPIDGPGSGMWPTGGAWLTLHLWDHYDYSGDKAFLAKADPAIQRCVAVLRRYAGREDPSTIGWPRIHRSPPKTRIHSAPPLSPVPRWICRFFAIFSRTPYPRAALKSSASMPISVSSLRRYPRARLAPSQTGSTTIAAEWLEDWDMQAKDIHHRHVSHLFGLYPSWQINRRDTPELAAKAEEIGLIS